MHDAVRRDIARGAHLILAEGRNHPPGRDGKAETVGIDLRQGVRAEARQNVQPIRQETLQDHQRVQIVIAGRLP